MKTRSNGAYSELYAKGLAVGHSQIHTDSVDFVFRNEHFSIPTFHTVGITDWNGYFYTAKVAKLRALSKKLKKEEAHG